MPSNQTKLKLYQPACYRICVQGVLDEEWADYFGDLLITCNQTAGPRAETILTASVIDQAMLLGLLNYLCGLGLCLLWVEWLVDGAPCRGH
jgi:hypothetical protein